jgi:hypothetical protein
MSRFIVMLSVIMLNVVMLSVVMLSVVAPITNDIIDDILLPGQSRVRHL